MKPAIVLQTDFTKDISTCAMEGVCQLVDPELRTFDNTHAIPPFDTYTASTRLAYTVKYWPVKTVFVSVVDPGVGTSRRACVAKLANGSYIVTPDNGTLTHMLTAPGIDAVRVIDENVNRLPGSEGINVFHGRDIFAYCAARLASGIITFEQVGQEYPVEEIVRHEIQIPEVSADGTILGMIEMLDPHFGLVFSNIPMETFGQQGIEYGDELEVTITHGNRVYFSNRVRYQPSFGAVQPGEPVLLNSSTRTIQIAINLRNIIELFEIGSGPGWGIEMTPVR